MTHTLRTKAIHVSHASVSLATMFLLMLSSTSPRAQDFRTWAVASSAVHTLRDALGDIQAIKSIVMDIEAGKTPNATSNQWQNLAARFQRASTELRSAPMPTNFDASPYRVSADELRNCATRSGSILRLRGYLAAIRDAVSAGEGARDTLSGALGDVQAARSALDYLIRAHEKLISVPIYGQIFQWNWLDLELAVRPSLADLDSELRNRTAKLSTEIAKANQQADNLEANIAAIERLDCSPPPRITVSSATYGGNCGQPGGNVTGVVRRICEGERSCSFTAGNGLFGDPAYLCAKSFSVSYNCGSRPRSVSFAARQNEDFAVSLSCQ